MADTVLVYRSTPPYVPGDRLPCVVTDGREQTHIFFDPAYVDAAASRQATDGEVEHLLHVMGKG